MSIKSKIQALITAANAKTGETDATLTDAVQSLVDGYGGGAPIINPLSVTANGTYTAPAGVDGYSPVTVNVPQGITPSGNINITDTNVTDVTNYATATVVDADLVAENIKKDVNILGIIGTFEGGGGGSLPSVINKIDGGSFTVASDTNGTQINITHSLGVEPTGYLIWTDDISYGSAETKIYIVRAFFNAVSYSATQDAVYYFVRKATSGAFGTTQAAIAITAHSNWVTSSALNIGITSNLKGGCTYKWLAWA